MKTLDTVPLTGLVALAQAAFGCGVGLLLAGRMRESVQRTTAITLFSVGVVSTVSLAVGLASNAWNRPESARGMRRRLKSIREDSGFTEDAEIL